MVVEVRALRDGVSSAIQTNFDKPVTKGGDQIVIEAPKENI